ncbi:hypothetical protein I316_01588 [Kwoniella heveanensis BCC8398]|uniref:DNA topoisomerase (ATP-hydrolyzing) n=1 Tax=Kwoniella heveanensis BCC8398 TaxID=1296120 RepID=A0A1B9H162_9TREE|nr:hypothetical protein I316_01588 [Kwoniella heveanensis BCC8398]
MSSLQTLLEHAQFLAVPSGPLPQLADPYSFSPSPSSSRPPALTSSLPATCTSHSHSHSQPLPESPPPHNSQRQSLTLIVHPQSQPIYSPFQAQADECTLHRSQSQYQRQCPSPYQGLMFKSQGMASLLESSYTYSHPPYLSSSSSTASPASLLSSSSSCPASRGKKRTIELPSDSESDPGEEGEEKDAAWEGDTEMRIHDWLEAEPTQVTIYDPFSPVSSLGHLQPVTSFPESVRGIDKPPPSTGNRGPWPKGKRWIDIPSDDSDSEDDYGAEADMTYCEDEDAQDQVAGSPNDHLQYRTEAGTDEEVDSDHRSSQDATLLSQGSYEEEDEDFIVLDDSVSQEDIASHSRLSMISTPLTTPYMPHWRKGKTPDDDAAIFEDLVRRTEAKRGYEELHRPVTQSDSQAGPNEEADNDIGGRVVPAGGRVMHLVDNVRTLTNQTEGDCAKASAFLENLLLGFLVGIREAQSSISEPNKIDSYAAIHKRSQKKRKVSTANTEVAESSQSLSQSGTQGGTDSAPKRMNSSLKVALVLRNRKTGNKEPSMGRFTAVFAIATVLYEAIHSKTVVTLRDIFYRDKALFKRQDVVDRLVDDLIATAGLRRKDFYVCASAKGLIASSSLVIHRRSGEVVRLSPTSATLIDPIERIDRIEVAQAQTIEWVLVVEKDAVFQTLCSARLLGDDRLGQGVMLTGKGFPDLSTRQMLRLLADTYPNARIYALVDADPHGLKILSTYKYGAERTAHSFDHHGLALGDRMEWLGVKASDFASLGICYDELLPLEKVDIQLASNMLKNQRRLPTEWKRELSTMLHLNKKAEIEIILSHRESDQRPKHGQASQLGSRNRSAVVDSFDVALSNTGPGKGDPAAGKSTDGAPAYQSQDVGRVRNALVEYIVERICRAEG